MWIKGNFFKYSIGLVIVLLIIVLFGQIGFFLKPFERFLAAVFLPLLISGLFYYLFRPLVRLAEKLKLTDTVGIIFVFAVTILILYLFFNYIGGIVGTQLDRLITNFPSIINSIEEKASEIIKTNNIEVLLPDDFKTNISEQAQKLIPVISGGLVSVVSALINAATTILLVPFILFFLLKDDNLFYKKTVAVLPASYKDEIITIMKDTDKALSTYIVGRAIISLIIGVLTFIGYLIIGLDYAALLAIFAMVTSFVPLIGSYVGTLPAVLVALTMNPAMIVTVLIVMVIVQQVDGNVVTPAFIGKRMDIHPLTIIIVFLGAAVLYGLLGMLLAVPAYAVLKVLISGGIRIYKIWKKNLGTANL